MKRATRTATIRSALTSIDMNTFMAIIMGRPRLHSPVPCAWP
jgi:hypothetical protein